jgi:hypothetical protein
MKKFIEWLKTNWLQVANFIVLLLIYGVNNGQLGVEVITGLWIFSLAGIYGWRWFKNSNK